MLNFVNFLFFEIEKLQFKILFLGFLEAANLLQNQRIKSVHFFKDTLL